MAVLKCLCGHSISNTIAPCPNEGSIFGNCAEDAWQTQAVNAISEFLKADREGKKAEWIRNFWKTEYPDVDDANIIGDIWTHFSDRNYLNVLECESCGRIHIQSKFNENEYRSYLPEDGRCVGILKSNNESTALN